MKYAADNFLETAKQVWKEFQRTEHDQLLVLFGEENAPDLDRFVEDCRNAGIPVFGGLYTGVIHGGEFFKNGALYSVVPAPLGVHVVHKVGKHPEISDNLNNLDLSGHESWSIILLIDGLMTHISNMLSGLHDVFGDKVNFFGGGAGSFSLVQQPCIFSSEGVFQDAAIICPMPLKSGIGVKHGWEQIYGPVVATRTEGNTIYELNWEPAMEVYGKIVSENAGQEIKADNFFSIAKAYPFGIYREREEFIVRDPLIANEDGSITCVGEVPENTVLNILKGDQKSLLNAANQAAAMALLPDRELSALFVVDCISRTLFLENDFEKEIEMVKKAVPGKKPSGVTTLGEIASEDSGSLLTFFNKTVVVSAIYNEPTG
ncbi:MAG: FIST N-terminal domain-containing protein [Bacteroidia bacterium]